MEEQKIQSLHDTLAKLKKTAGLGIASHYNFGKVKTKQVNGQTVREDGLPNNPLYFPFVKEGTFDPKNAESKFGDGRTIKRNFDDCDEKVDDSVRSSDSSSGRNRSNNKLDKKSNKKKRMKEEAKGVKKAKKKAMKLEAKRQAKLEAKRQAKLEEKRAQKKLLEKKRIDNDDSCGGHDTNGIYNSSSNQNIETVDGINKVKKHKSKKDSRRKRKDNENNEQDDHTTNTLSSVTSPPSNSESKKKKQNESTITSASLLVPVSDDATVEGKDKMQTKRKSKKSKREKRTLE